MREFLRNGEGILRRRFWLIGGLVVVLLAAQAGTAGARGLRTGFLDPSASTASNIPGFPIDDAVASQKVAGAGADVVRLYAYWRRLAPTRPANPNDYQWAELTPQVDAAINHGLDVMLTLRSAPGWAQQHNCGNDPTTYSRGTCRPDPQAFHDFAHDLASHYSTGAYKTHVKYWDMWNEPNSPSFLSPQYVKRNGVKKSVAPDLYRALLNRGARAVHEVSADNVVVAGETAPFGFKNSHAPLDFLRRLLCVTNGGKQTCSASRVEADIWTTHPYTSGNPWHHAFGKDDVSFGDLGQWKKLVKGAAKSGRFVDSSGHIRRSIRLWISEFSWDTKPPDDEAVPIKLHARWTAEALYRTWALGIEALIWLQLRDYPAGEFYQSGFYRYRNSTTQMGNRKLSFQAFRFPFVAYARNGRIKVWGRTPDSSAHSVKIERKTSSGWRVVKTVSASGAGIFTKRWSSGDRDGKYRARLAGTPNASVGFSLVRPRDRFVNPFGGP
jgi:Cellulase (glycosyl hydrolase family 5)